MASLQLTRVIRLSVGQNMCKMLEESFARGAIEVPHGRRLRWRTWLHNTEQLKKKNIGEPKCWADLTKTQFKDEIQVTNPNLSGTSYTMLATLVQLMGEDKAFDYLKSLDKNINHYTKSDAGPARAAATGESLVGITFQHDAVVQAVGGASVKIVSPCEGTGYGIGSMSIIKGAKNMDNAKKWHDWAVTPEAQAIGGQWATSSSHSGDGTFSPSSSAMGMLLLALKHLHES